MLFDKQFVFYGTNAEHVIALVDKQHVFDRVFDVYLLGAVVGFLNNRRNTVKKDSPATKTIFADILVEHQDTLEFIYKLIFLLDKEYEPVFDKRVDKAFRDIYTEEKPISPKNKGEKTTTKSTPKNKKDFERFNDYVRGGVEIIYEHVLGKPVASDEEKVLRVKELLDYCSKFDGSLSDLIKSIDI